MESKKSEFFSVRNMTFMALAAAIICVAAPFSIPMPWLVPISLGTFAIYLAGGVLGAKRATVAVVVYILLGAVGLPVFTGFTGGLAKLLGVTGGYIIGYIPLALITGLFSDLSEKRPWLMPVGMAAGTAVLYTFGTAWYIIFTGSGLAAALLGCVVPFLVGDSIKIIAASGVAVPLRNRIKGFVK